MRIFDGAGSIANSAVAEDVSSADYEAMAIGATTEDFAYFSGRFLLLGRLGRDLMSKSVYHEFEPV